MKPFHFWTLAGVAVVLVVLGRGAFKVTANADFNAPSHQPRAVDDVARVQSHNLDGHPGHVYGNHAGYVYTPCRYPRTVGGEISALIHHGHTVMRIPDADFSQWMIAPPSEQTWA